MSDGSWGEPTNRPPDDDETVRWDQPSPGAQPPAGSPPPGQWAPPPDPAAQPPPAQPDPWSAGAQPPPTPGWSQQPPAQQPPPQQPDPWGQPPQQAAGPLGTPGHDPMALGGPPSTVHQGDVRTGLPLGRIGLIVTVLALAGLGGFAVWRALDDPGGAATPEEAAAQVFDAAESEDLLGVIENMLPSERESMVEPMTDIMIELARLDILADEAVEGDQLNSLEGFTIDFPDEGQVGELVYDIEPLGSSESIRWVTVTDGLMTVTLDPREFRDGLGERFAEWIDAEMAEEDLEVQTEIVDLGDEFDTGAPLQFAVVEEDGSWYFSAWYTVAGFATDFRAPDLALAPNPVGGDSPEQAATRFLEGVIEFDLLTAMTMLDPDEFRAAYDYWAEYGPELVDGAADVRNQAAAEGFSWDVRSIEASSEDRNGRKVATISDMVVGLVGSADGIDVDVAIGLGQEGFRVDGTVQGSPIEVLVTQERASGRGSIEGESFDFDIDLVTYEGFAQFAGDRYDMVRNGDCLTVTINGTDSETLCGDELGADPSVAFDFQEDYQNLIDDIGTPGLTVVERDGRWYVSGFPTYAYTIVDWLKAVDEEEFDEFLDSYEELVRSFGTPDF